MVPTHSVIKKICHIPLVDVPIVFVISFVQVTPHIPMLNL